MLRTRVEVPDEKYLQLHRNTRPELYGYHINDMILPLEALSRYPDVESFQNKLSNYIKVSPDKLLITSGVDGAIKAFYELHKWPVGILVPTYKMYHVYAEAYGAELIPVSDITLDNIIEVLPKVKTMFIPNPHEPVEHVFSTEELNVIKAHAEFTGTTVVIDEAYYGFGAETAIPLAYRNLFVMRSFSKAWGLPGIRLGYIVGDVEELRDKRPAYETNSLSMAVASWAMDHHESFDEYIQEVCESREFMKKDLEKHGYETHGSLSNTILIKAPAMAARLKERGVLVRQIDDWISVTCGSRSTSWKFLEILYGLT